MSEKLASIKSDAHNAHPDLLSTLANSEVETITSAIKRVLRDHTRLVTDDMCQQVLVGVPDTGKIGGDAHGLVGERLRDIFDAIAESKNKEVVEAHRLLGVLIHHLQALSEHSKQTKMGTENLARVFAPTLVVDLPEETANSADPISLMQEHDRWIANSQRVLSLLLMLADAVWPLDGVKTGETASPWDIIMDWIQQDTQKRAVAVKKLFEELDSDGSGGVDIDELTEGTVRFGVWIRNRVGVATFEILSEDAPPTYPHTHPHPHPHHPAYKASSILASISLRHRRASSSTTATPTGTARSRSPNSPAL